MDVRLSNGANYRGVVLGVDEIADLALVDISSSRKFDPVSLGDSDAIAVGDEVVAVGFPLADQLGNSQTITTGVLSARRRFNGVERLQTDAAINPGNSGGPLFNRAGEVVGVNTSKLEESGGRPVDNIGFAVSINEVKTRLDSLSRGRDTRVNTPTPEPTRIARSRGRTASIDRVELRHEEDDGFIEEEIVMHDVRNFRIRADFDVPYPSRMGDWDVGFTFRDSGVGNFQYIVVTWDGKYAHWVRVEGEGEKRDYGTVANWNLGEGEKNRILLYVIEDRGWLFVNSEFVDDLDVSGGSRSGDLSVATGLYTGHEVDGATTVVRNIRAGEQVVLFGPDSGELTKNDTFIPTQRAGVDVSAGYASAEFRAPTDVGRWSAGIMFRKSGEDDYLMFYISSTTLWRVAHATYSGDGWVTLESEYYNVGDSAVNRLEVFFVGHVAALYINNRFMGTADISSVTASGDVMVAYGVYRNDEHSTARFENFTGWGSR